MVGCVAGGIVGVLEVLEAHPVEASRDVREKFHLSKHDLFVTVDNGESVELVRSLLRDPSSWLAAAVSGWSHPFSWTDQYIVAGIDTLRSRWMSEFQPFPKPTDKRPEGISREAALRKLRPHQFKEG